jgi:hypothetical protein
VYESTGGPEVTPGSPGEQPRPLGSFGGERKDLAVRSGPDRWNELLHMERIAPCLERAQLRIERSTCQTPTV